LAVVERGHGSLNCTLSGYTMSLFNQIAVREILFKNNDIKIAQMDQVVNIWRDILVIVAEINVYTVPHEWFIV